MIKFFALLTVLVVCQGDQREDWWKNAVVYQIYPRSFKDSDGDGIGDLQGIISKLEILKEAGVDATWLSPIYKSPQVDAGYDISDYRDINEEYGTMEDFEEMAAKAKELGIKIIMDLVPNHSSDQHEWFIKSENREEGYEDYYVWADGKDDQTPPNNWISVFKYSAWKYSEKRKQWYLHQFAAEQPDLNYNNPKVVQEMKDIIQFWMEKGVDGFRVDAIPHLIETGMEDEPRSNDPNATPDEWNYLEHIYTHSQPQTYEMVYEFRDFIDEYNNQHPDGDIRIMMVEAYTNLSNTMKYYTDGEKLGAHFPFNFELIFLNSDSTAVDIAQTIQNWLNWMPKGHIADWVIGNHDNHRIASRVGIENIDGYNMITTMLPGVTVTYNGEEIGMEDGYVSWEEGKDPGACNGSPEDFNKTSRDFERTPYHWDDSNMAGFTDGDSTWLPVSEKYLENNLAFQLEEENSHFKIYQKLTSLKHSEEFAANDQVRVGILSTHALVIRRFGTDNKYWVVFNPSNRSFDVDLNDFPGIAPEETVEILISSANRSGILKSASIDLGPHESLVVIEIKN